MAETTFNDLLTQPIAFHRVFSQITGSVTAGVMLSQAFYWSKTKADRWFYKTQLEWTKETTLTRTEQETARKKLVALKVLEEKKRGLPAKLYYRVNFERLETIALEYAENLQTGVQETCQQACNIPATKSAENLQTFKGTENTTENTTEKKKKPVSDEPKPSKLKTSDLSDEQKQDFNLGMDFLKQKIGKYPDGAAQGKALKWMIQNGASIAQIQNGLERQISEFQGRYRATYLSLQKIIFQWNDEEKGVIKYDGTSNNTKETDQSRRQREAAERNKFFRNADEILAERDRVLQIENGANPSQSAQPLKFSQVQ